MPAGRPVRSLLSLPMADLRELVKECDLHLHPPEGQPAYGAAMPERVRKFLEQLVRHFAALDAQELAHLDAIRVRVDEDPNLSDTTKETIRWHLTGYEREDAKGRQQIRTLVSEATTPRPAATKPDAGRPSRGSRSIPGLPAGVRRGAFTTPLRPPPTKP